jgi:hypothetical integral membrane protein (TIGR02206 family)
MAAADFRMFGPDHLGALAATAVVATLMIVRARRLPAAGRILAVIIVAAQVADPFVSYAAGHLSWQKSLPLELCDLAALATVVALWTRRQTAFEFAWFWGLTGTLQALLTPAVVHGFPHPEFLRFFLLHGAIVVGVLHLGPGLGMAPRRGALWRVYGWTALYAAAMGLIDWAIDANYFFLCYRPEGSVLEVFGPWPYYILGGAVIGAVFFWLVDLPFRVRSAAGARRAPP